MSSSKLLSSQFKDIYGAFLLMLILSVPCFAAPSYTSWNNSKDNSTYFPDLNHSENISFNCTADEAITQYYWYKDETLLSNNWDNYTTSFSTGYTHNVSVIAHSATGNTTMLSWYPTVYREVATATAESLNDTPYTDMIDAVEEESFEGFIGASIDPYTNVMGTVFYLALFGTYMLMLAIRQKGLTSTMVLVFSFGSILLGYITESFTQSIIALLIIMLSSVAYSMFRERR